MLGCHLLNINKEIGIKHGSRPPEGKSKAIIATTAHAQSTHALQCATRSILCTKHVKLCQDTSADKRLNPIAEYDIRKFAMSHTQASSSNAPTMSTIAPGNHDVLMSEFDISAALHASDRPAKKQLSPKDAMQTPTNVL